MVNIYRHISFFFYTDYLHSKIEWKNIGTIHDRTLEGLRPEASLIFLLLQQYVTWSNELHNCSLYFHDETNIIEYSGDLINVTYNKSSLLLIC